MSDIVERLRAVDHMSLEDCFLQSPLYSRAADEIQRLRDELASTRAENAGLRERNAVWAVSFAEKCNDCEGLKLQNRELAAAIRAGATREGSEG